MIILFPFFTLKDSIFEIALSILVFSLIAIGFGLFDDPEEKVSKNISFFFFVII